MDEGWPELPGGSADSVLDGQVPESQVSAPKHGRTVYAHVEQSLERAEAALTDASYRIQRTPRLSKAKRIAIWRQLAGVVSDVESIRIWLEFGAPR